MRRHPLHCYWVGLAPATHGPRTRLARRSIVAFLSPLGILRVYSEVFSKRKFVPNERLNFYHAWDARPWLASSLDTAMPHVWFCFAGVVCSSIQQNLHRLLASLCTCKMCCCSQKGQANDCLGAIQGPSTIEILQPPFDVGGFVQIHSAGKGFVSGA